MSIYDIGAAAKQSSILLAAMGTEAKNQALEAIAASLNANAQAIFNANAEDMKEAADLPTPVQKRLKFDEKKLKILRYIRDNGGEYAHAELLKRSHESKEVFGKIIDTLAEADEIRTEWRETGGRKQQKVYVLASETSQRDFPNANSSQ